MIQSHIYAAEDLPPLTLEWANPQQASNALAKFFIGPFTYYMSIDPITGEQWATVVCQAAGRVAAMFRCDEDTVCRILDITPIGC